MGGLSSWGSAKDQTLVCSVSKQGNRLAAVVLPRSGTYAPAIMNSRYSLPLHPALLFVAFLSLSLLYVTHSSQATGFEVEPSDLRISADFPDSVKHGQVPQVDLGAGETRLSRIWRGRDFHWTPWDARGSRIDLGSCLSIGPGESLAFQPQTDAAIRALGNLNVRSGTFAFWMEPGSVAEDGGVLFSGKSYIPGGTEGGVGWAIGIGGNEESFAPAGRLFLSTSEVLCIADEPLPESDWVHVAAVWDADMGARLYLDGRRVGETWRDPETSPESDAQTKVVFPETTFPDSLNDWTVSFGTGHRSWFDLMQGGFPFDEVEISLRAGKVLEIASGYPDRIQLRSPSIGPFPPGVYLARLRYRQTFGDLPSDTTPRGLGVRMALQGAASRFVAFSAPDHEVENTETLEQLFVVGEEQGEESVELIFDINLWTPGVTILEDLRLIKADPDGFETSAGGGLLTSYGTHFSDLLHHLDPIPVERLHVHQQPSVGGYTGLRLYDGPLAESAIRGLAGEDGVAGEPVFEPVPPHRERRRTRLGWGREVEGDLLPWHPGTPLLIEEQWPSRAFEDRRAAGLLAVDGKGATLSPWPYHGYQHVTPRKLHLKFPEPIQANYLVARGNLNGSLRAGGSRAEPRDGEEVVHLPGTPLTLRLFLSDEFEADSATVVRENGQLSGLHFYRISPDPSGRNPDAGLRLHFSEGRQPLPLPELKYQEFITSYPSQDRSFAVGNPEPGTESVARELKALRAHHFFSPPMEQDFALGAIGLQLYLRDQESGTDPGRVQIRFHDAFAPWRELGRFDFHLQEAATGQQLELVFDLRETLIPEGHAAWVTVIPEKDLELLYAPETAQSQMVLYPADREVAGKQWMERELASWRTAFESTSEPRPWNRGVTDDPESAWWLKAASPQYERMWLVSEELLRRFPEDPRVAAWFAFIRPDMAHPARNIDPPSATEDAPEWAVLARANLQLYREFVEWWMQERAHENGEFGNWIGDDSCLLQDWPDLALIDDPEGRYQKAVRRLADGVYDRFTIRGRPFLVDGLNSRWTDALHAYEDGINLQPMNFLLDYGNPLLLYRLFETAERYDGFLMTGEEQGIRRWNSPGNGEVFWSTDREPTGDPLDPGWFLASHPGQVILWFNENPRVLQEFQELGQWLLQSQAVGDPPRLDTGGWDFFVALYALTGEEQWLDPLLDWQATTRSGELRVRRQGPFDPSFVKLLPTEGWDAERTAATLRRDAETRYTNIGTRQLGFWDRRYERNWLEWKLTGNKEYLNEGLRELYRRLKFSMPAVTVAEQSGDRVSIPKQLISQMYLGGIPAARNHQFFPLYAVTYENMGTNFAGLVTDDQKDNLRVLFYNFEPEPIQGLMRVWRLVPGTYEIRGGPDLTGDDRMDAVNHRTSVELVRGDALELELPPGQVTVWEARLTEPAPPLHERPDLAVTHEDASWSETGGLRVRVHNIGSADHGPSQLLLFAEDGQQLDQREVPPLQAPLDLRPSYAEVEFTAGEIHQVAADGSGHVTVWVDGDPGVPEITLRNNVTTIPIPTNVEP